MYPCLLAMFIHTLGLLADLRLSSVHTVPLCLCLKRTLLLLYVCPCCVRASDPGVNMHFGAVLLVSYIGFILDLNPFADFTTQQKSCIILARST